MVDVNVSIYGIILYCDDCLMHINIGNGYYFCKEYLDESPLKEKITDGAGKLDFSYMGSQLRDENGIYFICLRKNDTFQIPGLQIEDSKTFVITDKQAMCEEQLYQYNDEEMDYMHMFFSLLRVYKACNCAPRQIFQDYRYTLIFNNTVNHSDTYIARNTVDERKLELNVDEINDCNRFIAEYSGKTYYVLKDIINVFISGMEEITLSTEFEQYTKMLEMTLLERNQQGKKQALANRVAILLGSSDNEISQIHSKMLDYYRYRSESLHEGDSSNISKNEVGEIEDICRKILHIILKRVHDDLLINDTFTWETIKHNMISEIINNVLVAKENGLLPE